MTEEEWQMCGDPTPMLEFLFGEETYNHRKLILLSIACQPFEDMDDADFHFVERVAEKKESVLPLVGILLGGGW